MMNKNIVALALTASLALTVAACSGNTAPSVDDVPQEQTAETSIKQSPDKYTWYIKDYVGMNAASVGYEAIDGFRHDAYGSGNIKLVFVAADGTYVDPGNDDQLKEYVVTGQNVKPNTEMKYEYEVDSDGEEYDNLINFQTIDEVVLSVDKVGASDSAAKLTEIAPSPDKYTHYIRDYVGRNLAECGYYSLSGKLADAYGHGYIFFDIVADDGSFVDPEDEAQLAGYMVVAQSVEPNTEIRLTYAADSDGEEYGNLVNGQSIETVTLNVTKAPDSGYPIGDDSGDEPEASDDIDSETAPAHDAESESTSSTDFRAFLDTYEDFMNEYVDFMVSYKDSGDTASMLAEYSDMMARYADMAEQLEDIEEDSLSADDYAYYMEVMGRVTARMSEVGQ